LIRTTLAILAVLTALLALAGCKSPEAECRESVYCERWGACAQVDHETRHKLDDFFCGPTSQEHCGEASWGCKQDGACTLRDDECVVGSDADCAASTLECGVEGRCTARGGRCVAAGDDCKQALICKAHRACAAVDDECSFSRDRRVEIYRRAMASEQNAASWCVPGEEECRDREEIALYHCLSASDERRMPFRQCIEEKRRPYGVDVARAASTEQLAILCRQNCERNARCGVRDGTCVVAHKIDCRRTRDCKYIEECTAIDGACGANE
jgi:hypothetical protein